MKANINNYEIKIKSEHITCSIIKPANLFFTPSVPLLFDAAKAPPVGPATTVNRDNTGMREINEEK